MNADNGYIYWMGLAMQPYTDMAMERLKRIYQQQSELETISGLSVDNIIELFKKGYRLEEPSDVSREFETQMEIIALQQENAVLRRKNKKLRRRISRRLFGGKRK